MKEEEIRNKATTKITPLQITDEMLDDPEMDRFLRNSLMQEADEIEKELNEGSELNEDSEIMGDGNSDVLFQAIVRELKKQNVWEEENKEREQTEHVNQKQRPGKEVLPQEDIYTLISEEDRQVLEPGQEVPENKQASGYKSRRWQQTVRITGIAVASLVLILSMGMSSEANLRLVWNALGVMAANFNLQLPAKYSDEDMVSRNKAEEEIAAIADIQNTLNIPMIDFACLSEEMEFDGCAIMADSKDMKLFYTYNDNNFFIFMQNQRQEGAANYMMDQDVDLVNTIETKGRYKARIWETNWGLEENAHVAQTDYKNVNYIVKGMLPVEEMDKIFKYSIIL